MSERQREIARLLKAAAGSAERRALVCELARAHGVVAATIYRWGRRGGWSSERNARKDAGTRRSGVTNGQLDLVAGIRARSQRADGRLPAATSAVVELLQANGQLPDVSPSTVQRLLRERQLASAQMRGPAVYVSRRCEVGEVFQFDSSPSMMWDFRDGDGFRRRPDKVLWAAGKPETMRAIRRHLIRYFCVDKASNLWCGSYVHATGETPVDTIRVLLEAFALMGVPRAIVLDRGAGNVAFETQMFLWLLGVEVQWKGHSKNTMGAVEGLHNRVQQRLEFRWSLCPPADVPAANLSLARWWSDDVRQAVVRRSGHTRLDMFATLKQNIVRRCPDPRLLWGCIHKRPETRLVSGEGTLQFHGREFLVEGRRLRNQRVWVAHDPWDLPNAVVLVGFDRETLTCEERIPARLIERDYLGFYREMPRWGLGDGHPVGTRLPDHEAGLREASKAATRLKRDGGMDWYADLGPIHRQPEAEAVRGLVDRRGGDVELEAHERPVPAGEAVWRAYERIESQHGRAPSPDELAVLRQWDEAGQPVSVDQIRQLASPGAAGEQQTKGGAG